MSVNDQAQNRLAVLIDADNAQPSITEGLLSEIAKYGVASVKRIYGDWTTPSLSGWKAILLEHSIQPVQQFRYTVGKNATDSAMIIDAMDLLYSGSVDAFALMTSDSDFTPLVLRILESGLPVYGFGEKKTPKPFVDACSPFIFTENLINEDEETTDKPKQLIKKNKNEIRMDTSLVRLLRTAVEQTSDDDGWADMSKVGSYINNNSSFSSINYGYKKLGDLVRASELFNIEMRRDGKSMFIKDARK